MNTTLLIKKGPHGTPPAPRWRGPYVPLLLDYDAENRTWSLITTVNMCEEWIALGRPNPPYIEFASRNGAPWQHVPLKDRFIGREANLLTDPSTEGEPDLVTPAYKREVNSRVAPMHRQIIPDRGPKQGNFCPLK
ncbi:hypothetical protein ACFFGH_18255 [Lysobacter korlensis]|uniref:Uncharacterized protein n=1 Tax=Lysobacter korlensis TaxID=553636 RepID=A0ABV6RS31_9GAMM